MKIAIVSTFKSMGGISIHTRELLREFQKRNHQVTIIPEADLPLLLSTEHYLAVLSRGFDIVNIQGTSKIGPIIAGLLASRGTVGGCVCTSHGFSPPRWYAKTISRKVMRGTLRRYGAMISISKFVERRLLSFFGQDRPRIITVYDGVDGNLFSPDVDYAGLKTRMGLTGKKVILYVGRITEKKGVHHLLRAFAIARAQDPQLALVYCGRGQMDTELRIMTEELGLGGSVCFAGAISHDALPPYYAMCDVLAVPSTYENLGLAPLEAMSTGRPVVASDTGGLPEIVENMKTGLLVHPGDPEALAEGLLTIIHHPDLANRLGSVGRKVVLEKYTLARCAEATIDVYRKVLRCPA